MRPVYAVYLKIFSSAFFVCFAMLEHVEIFYFHWDYSMSIDVSRLRREGNWRIQASLLQRATSSNLIRSTLFLYTYKENA